MGVGVEVGGEVAVGTCVGARVKVGVTVGVSVGQAVGEAVASAKRTSGIVVTTQRLTMVTSTRITISVSPSNKRFIERCIPFVFPSSYPHKVGALYHES